MDIFERARQFENRKWSGLTTSDRIEASREAKELILSLNELYKKTNDSALMDLMKRLTALKKKTQQAKKQRERVNHHVTEADLSGPKIFARVSHRSFGNGSMKPDRFLATAPKGKSK